MKFRALLPSVLTAFLVSTALSASWQEPTTPTTPGGGAIGQASVGDPIGDPFGNPLFDIVSFAVVTDGANVIFDIVFNGTISAPGSGLADEVFGFTDIDTDQDLNTGIPGGNVSGFCPSPVNFGVDFVLNCFGGCTVVDAGGNVTGAPSDISVVGGNTLHIEIPHTVLGNDDGIVDTATVLGDAIAPSDCAPDGAFLTSDMVPVELMHFAVE